MRVVVFLLCVSLTFAAKNASHVLDEGEATRPPCRLDVCLALDSSSGKSLYAERRVSLQLASSLLGYSHGKGTKIAAVQFGTITRRLSQLTNDLQSFQERLNGKADVGDERNSNGGFLGCRFLLGDESETQRQTHKAIVVMVGGDATIGGSIEADVRAFREQGGTVIVLVNGNVQGEWLRELSDGNGSVMIVRELWRREKIMSASRRIQQKLCSRD